MQKNRKIKLTIFYVILGVIVIKLMFYFYSPVQRCVSRRSEELEEKGISLNVEDSARFKEACKIEVENKK